MRYQPLVQVVHRQFVQALLLHLRLQVALLIHGHPLLAYQLLRAQVLRLRLR